MYASQHLLKGFVFRFFLTASEAILGYQESDVHLLIFFSSHNCAQAQNGGNIAKQGKTDM